MPVYVDNAKNPYGRMLMCHMVADTIGELLEMADEIKIARRHFQPWSHPHFDLSQSYRARAVSKGAIQVNRRQLVDAMKRHRLLMLENPSEVAAYESATANSTRGKSKPGCRLIKVAILPR